MKQGRFLKLVNGTAYDWIRTDGQSCEMLTWNLPDRVKAGTAAFAYVEWEPGIKDSQGYLVGEAAYCLKGTEDIFRIQAGAEGNAVRLTVYYGDLTGKYIPQDATVPLVISRDGYAVFILSGIHGDYAAAAGEEYKSESISWSACTEGISSIDNLCLYGTHLWEKCEIYLQGYENKNTGCMITLISNGEIHKEGRVDWMELVGTQSRTYSFEIHKKVSLVVAGYISNPAIIGGGASITLTGFYK